MFRALQDMAAEPRDEPPGWEGPESGGLPELEGRGCERESSVVGGLEGRVRGRESSVVGGPGGGGEGPREGELGPVRCCQEQVQRRPYGVTRTSEVETLVSLSQCSYGNRSHIGLDLRVGGEVGGRGCRPLVLVLCSWEAGV